MFTMSVRTGLHFTRPFPARLFAGLNRVELNPVGLNLVALNPVTFSRNRPLAIAAAALVLGWGICTDASAEELPTVGEIVRRMDQADSVRLGALETYTVMRRYELTNHRFKKTASIVARMTYHHPGDKEFEVVSEEGSRIIRDRILKRVMDTESEASHGSNRTLARIDETNYDLSVAGIEQEDGRTLFVLSLTPKSKSPYLIRGRAWIDAQEYAVVRLEGTPAKKPSRFAGSPLIRQSYVKRGQFWVPERNLSVTDAPIFGKTDLLIESTGYEIQSSGSAGDLAVIQH